MAEKPIAMYRNSRQPTPVEPDEPLYRRVQPDLWGDPHPEVDALDIPDMSVNRGPPTGEPEWVLLEADEHADWGIVFFACKDVPAEMKHVDGTAFSFRVEHAPINANYPHTEVRVYLNKTRIPKKGFDRDLSLRWRNKLLQRTRVYQRPSDL